MTSDVTVVICARDAAETIARAVRSAAVQCASIVLVDDHSTDDTVACARKMAAVDVVRPVRHGTMGETRQAGLEAVGTPYVVWLDADDELLPGRVSRLLEALHTSDGHLASDGVELVDGPSGESRGTAAVPAFVRDAPVRLFERMYLPGPGVIAARTAFARGIGYDGSLHGCEDADFLLRALGRGARIRLVDDVGYRLYAYPSSLSRDRDRQRRMYRRVLQKHSYEIVDDLYRRAGLPPGITAWALVSIAMFREEYAAALDLVGRAARAGGAGDVIEEPAGPCPHSEAWRVAFARGTARLLLGDTVGAAGDLERAVRMLPLPEALNNLGVACVRGGRAQRAPALFERALAARPGYADARENLTSPTPARVTTHPLRIEGARQDYTSLPSASS